MTTRFDDAPESTPKRCRGDDAFRALSVMTSAGCVSAFTRLYALTHRHVFATVLRIVGHRAEAEDILQEVYAEAWSRSAGFDPGRAHAAHWIASMAQRAALDTLRRREGRLHEVDLEPGGDTSHWQFVSLEPSPSERLECTEIRVAVQRQLSTLPDDQRESLVLAFFDGLTHAEIATRLDCPLGTVKSRLRRALMSLRAGLQFAA